MKVADIIKPISHHNLSEHEAEVLIEAVKKVRELQRRRFDETLSRATRIVESWPAWKRNCLGVLRPK
jgi:hypothetical protein